MLRADQNETFPIVAALIDDSTGEFVSGETVYYDVRNADDDSELSPVLLGTLIESTVKQGIYKTTLNIPDDGVYICYTSCSGFLTATEDLIINSENLYNLIKQDRHYNISVEDVIRTTIIPTASQTVRKVPHGKTDYVATRIKGDDDSDWSTTTASGVVFAWYKTVSDEVPYKMGGPY